MDALQLIQVSEGEGAQPLPRGGRGRYLEAVAQLTRHGLLAQDAEIGEAVATHQEVRRQPHHEVFDRDAAPALLDGQRLEIADHAQLGGEVEYEAQAGERRRVLGGGTELDAAETRWDLHLTSAPSLERETSRQTFLTKTGALFLCLSHAADRFRPPVTRGSGLK